MANSTLTSLTGLSSPASSDSLYIVDASDTTDGASGTSKKITYGDLTSSLATAGANSNITSLSGLTTPLSVAQGGSGAATLTGILKGNGTSAFTAVTAPSGTIVGTSDTQTLTNKTLTSPTINVGSDAQGDVYYRNGSGAFTRLAPGTSGQFLQTQGAGANPQWANSTGIISTTQYAPQGFLINGRISTSVASNNLTVAIKGMDGNDPSASNPVYCRIGNTVRTITAALSVTKNAGTNWFDSGSAETATKEIDYFAYLGYNATDGVVVGFSRIPYARKYGDFNTTSTNDKYAAISTITNAASTDEYELIGRFNATLSATASFNWSIPATSIVINRPIFETRILDWLPSYTGFSSAPASAMKYLIRMTQCFVKLAGTGTSNSATYDLTLPITAVDQIGATFHAFVGVFDNSNWSSTLGVVGIAIGGSASKTAKAGINFTTAAANAFGGFTTSNSKGIFGGFFFDV